jgi:peptidoglycan hydrolase-like protein with peptidoglycan-binding domain
VEIGVMALQSSLFSADRALQECLVNDRAHVTTGAIGEHVTNIQSALVALEDAAIDVGELRQGRYGPSTAAAVLAFKKRRQIINRSYQSQADNIVGKMTIAALDREMLALEHRWQQRIFPPPGASA